MSNIEMYFDGSGNTSDPSLRFITLSAFISHDHIWRSFELKWEALLGKYQIANFHMTDARVRRGLFKNWKRKDIDKLLRRLLCIIGEYRQTDFECYSCIIALEDYKRASTNIKSNGYKLRSPESICVNACAGRIPIPKACTGIKLFFDRNEKFMHKINRNWESKKNRRSGWTRKIESIVASNSSTPGIQAADIFAWLTRIHYENPNHPMNPLFFVSNIIAGHLYEYFDYERILSTYPEG